MRDLWKDGTIYKVLTIVIIIMLLGISPIAHEVKPAFVKAERAKKFGNPGAVAENLALIAGHLHWRHGLLEQAGHYALAAGNHESAIQYYKNTAADGVLSHQGYIGFGDAYASIGNYYTAIQIWDLAINLYQPTEEVLTRMADGYRSLGDISQLIESLKYLLDFSLSNPESKSSELDLNYEIGFLLAAQNPESAPPYLLQASGIDPNLVGARELAFTIQRALPYENPGFTRMAAGRKLGSLNMWNLALIAFRGVVERQPEYSEAWAYLGESLQHLDKSTPTEALSALETALAINPYSLSANIFTALYWMRIGNPELSYHYLEIASEIDPGNPGILMDLADVAAMTGELEDAARYYQEAIDLTHNQASTLRKFVEFCLRYNLDLEGVALPAARQALSADFANPASLDVMGQVMFRLGDLYSAERFFLRAIQADSNYAPAFQHLGLTYSILDRPGLANDAFNRAETLNRERSFEPLFDQFFDIPLTP